MDSIYLILGPESALAERALTKLQAELKEEKCEVTTLFAGETVVGDIADALAPSLFSERRALIIRDLQDLPEENRPEITRYIEAPDQLTTVIFVHKGGVKGKALLEKIKKAKPTVIACDVIKKDGEKSDFIRSEFKRLGRTISTEAVQALIDALGSDLRELGGACSQLAADVAAGKMIDETDVMKFQNGRVETTGFDVADAALDGHRDVALIALRNALATGTDPVLITSALAGSLRTLAKVSGASRGVKSFDLAGPLGLAPWQIDKARRQLSKWTPATLAGAVVAVAQADADIKGAAVDPIHSLERAIIAITSRV